MLLLAGPSVLVLVPSLARPSGWPSLGLRRWTLLGLAGSGPDPVPSRLGRPGQGQASLQAKARRWATNPTQREARRWWANQKVLGLQAPLR